MDGSSKSRMVPLFNDSGSSSKSSRRYGSSSKSSSKNVHFERSSTTIDGSSKSRMVPPFNNSGRYGSSSKSRMVPPFNDSGRYGSSSKNVHVVHHLAPSVKELVGRDRATKGGVFGPLGAGLDKALKLDNVPLQPFLALLFEGKK